MKFRAVPRYVLVAGFCLVLNNVVLVAADALGFGTAIAVLASFAIVLTSGYLLHCAFTFRERLSANGFARYGLGMAANIPVAFAALYLMHDVLALPMAAAGPLVSVGMLVVNFVLSRWAIARPSPKLENNR